MSVPPCELAQGLKHATTNTLVAKMLVGGLSGLLWDWATSQVVVGAGCCAVIDMPSGDTYVAVLGKGIHHVFRGYQHEGHD